MTRENYFCKALGGAAAQQAAVFACAFALYLANLAPGVVWGDSAKLSLYAWQGHFGAAPSLHSLHAAVGRLFGLLPFGDYAFRINLMSAFWGAAAVSLVYRSALLLTGRAFPALAAAASLAVSHSFFMFSVIAETYSLHVFFLSASFFALLKWRSGAGAAALACAGAFFFLGCSLHLAAAVALPAFAWLAAAPGRQGPLGARGAALAAAGCLLGLSPMLAGWASEVRSSGLAGLAAALGADPARVWISFKGPSELVRSAGRYLAMLFYQFPLVSAALGAAGAALSFRRRDGVAAGLALLFLCNFVFVVHYGFQRQHALSTGAYFAFSLWVGLGAERLAGSAAFGAPAARAGLLALILLMPPVFYSSALMASRRLGIDLVGARRAPFRDNAEFFLLPWKGGERSAELYAREVFRTADRGALIAVDFTLKKVLDYFRAVEGARPDLRLVYVDHPFYRLDPALADEAFSGGAVYLASLEFPVDYSLAELGLKYDFVEEGPLYRLVLKNPAPGRKR